jgi:hypothetical protein
MSGREVSWWSNDPAQRSSRTSQEECPLALLSRIFAPGRLVTCGQSRSLQGTTMEGTMLYRVTARSRDGCFVMATGVWVVRASTSAEAISMARLIASRAVWPPRFLLVG